MSGACTKVARKPAILSAAKKFVNTDRRLTATLAFYTAAGFGWPEVSFGGFQF